MIDALVRPNIKKMTGYSSARHENTNLEAILLDANENPYASAYGRYPDPDQVALKKALAQYYKGTASQLFLGNGSDEAIDLLFRIFCTPGQDNIVVPLPSYGMYQVSADLNDIKVNTVLLNDDFSLPVNRCLSACNAQTKLMFLCSPNNPSGNVFNTESIEQILQEFKGIVVVDQAYLDFIPEKSMLPLLEKHKNLVVLQTLSKAWGLAGLRLGLAWANTEIIELFNKVKPPYNISTATQAIALEAVTTKQKEVQKWVKTLVEDREMLIQELQQLKIVTEVFPSDANYILVRFTDAKMVFDYLKGFGIVVRDRSKQALCAQCLRITIGDKKENTQLIKILNSIK